MDSAQSGVKSEQQAVKVPPKMNLKALQKIGYGMYIIGARKGEKLNAQIANTVFQITSEPPTLAVSINKKNLTHEYIMSSQCSLPRNTPLFHRAFWFQIGSRY